MILRGPCWLVHGNSVFPATMSPLRSLSDAGKRDVVEAHALRRWALVGIINPPSANGSGRGAGLESARFKAAM